MAELNEIVLLLAREALATRKMPGSEATETQQKKFTTTALKLRIGGVEYVRNAEKLVEWLEKNGRGALVKVEKRPEWDELKKLTATAGDGSVLIAENGEVVEDVKAERKPDTFTAEVLK